MTEPIDSELKRTRAELSFRPSNFHTLGWKMLSRWCERSFKMGVSRGMPDQVAAWAGMAGGSFRVTLSSARIFGLVTVSREVISLTELGNEILDPRTERKGARSKHSWVCRFTVLSSISIAENYYREIQLSTVRWPN